MIVDPYALAAAALLAIGFYGFAVQSHPLRRLLAINIFGNGVFLALILIARRLPEGPDPVPHAMVLTGIVIAVSATAFGLALVRRKAAEDNARRERRGG
ncbi:multicomponent Na+:H+ antiporter subunit C [Natronocella acetinitrilica]|uniref:Multicomponent Na+:H+ antiporter subunit C n=1 Tax=Natronocella acetinitrilica TaxID=414046 RepID=A0AAE3G330_9GAMM|nr:NADH-quinone oxidoreductase subunit K [Natronocella acetinitrilica]MCP1674910.1 multicomponent Na+:H+ antiporter subunit C [Natronocella acetinitrilica]